MTKLQQRLRNAKMLASDIAQAQGVVSRLRSAAENLRLIATQHKLHKTELMLSEAYNFSSQAILLLKEHMAEVGEIEIEIEN